MLRVILGLCAESVVRDADTNQISVFNVLEQLTAPGFPVLLQRFSAFWFFGKAEKDPDVYKGTVTIRLEGKELASLPITLGFQGKLQSRLMLRFGGLAIPNPGALEVALTIGDLKVEPWVVRVVKGEVDAPPGVTLVTAKPAAV